MDERWASSVSREMSFTHGLAVLHEVHFPVAGGGGWGRVGEGGGGWRRVEEGGGGWGSSTNAQLSQACRAAPSDKPGHPGPT